MKYPIGIQEFKSIIEDGYVYVDKTGRYDDASDFVDYRADVERPLPTSMHCADSSRLSSPAFYRSAATPVRMRQIHARYISSAPTSRRRRGLLTDGR